MGFGHRVYKSYDPRAKVMRGIYDQLLEATGVKDDPLFELAKELERIALEDDYFVTRKLYPNVDFYSGLIMKALGIPINMFTAIFALARTVGWLAHWKEMIEDPDQRITRPRQLYVGPAERRATSPSRIGARTVRSRSFRTVPRCPASAASSADSGMRAASPSSITAAAISVRSSPRSSGAARRSS